MRELYKFRPGLTDDEVIEAFRKMKPHVLGANFWYEGRLIQVPILGWEVQKNG